MIKFLLLMLMVSFSFGCSSQKEQPQKFSNTMKLQQSANIAFERNDLLNVKIQEGSSAKVRIFLKGVTGEKTLLQEDKLTSSSSIKIQLPEDITSYAYIIAILEGSEKNSIKFSAVDTYKIGEQELIEKEKARIKKLR